MRHMAQRAVVAAAFVALAVLPAHAQRGTGGGGGGAAGGRGGGGRGRAPMKVMALTTTAFTDGARIPEKYAQPGHEVSPPLAWSGVPDSTASFVLIVHDVDAAVGNGTDDLLQWMVWNIPASATSLAEHIPQGADLPDGSRQISVTGPYYRAPAAPNSGPVNHYVFELYALDVMLDVPAVGAQPAATRAAVVAAMAGHIRGKGTLVGLYQRTP
jgi:Raf kinase inhibitor-like YbhB/YbcL family protein